GTGDKIREHRDGKRNVVFEAGALVALCLGDALAQLPQRSALALAAHQCRIEHGSARKGCAERLLQHLIERLRSARGRQFAQQVPRVRGGKRVAHAGDVARGELQSGARDELEGADAIAAGRAQLPEQRHRGAHFRQRHQRRGAGADLREQLHSRGGDHPERALRAEKQRLDVVAGIVLAQRREALEDAPPGQHHLEPEHQVAHHAVAQHVHAAGIGREIAADLTAALRAQAQREEAPGRICRLLHLRQNAAGLRGQRVVGDVDAADAVQVLERQHQLPPGIIRDSAAAVAGVAAVWHHTDTLAVAQPQQLRNVRQRARLHHGHGAPAAAPEVVNEKRGAVRGIRQYAVNADDLAQPACQGWRGRCQWLPSARSAAMRSSSGGWLMNRRVRPPPPPAIPKAENCCEGSGSCTRLSSSSAAIMLAGIPSNSCRTMMVTKEATPRPSSERNTARSMMLPMTRDRKITKVLTTPCTSDRVTMSPLATWVISCPSTASISSRLMRCRSPLLTATRAALRLAPVAKAFGSGESKMPTSGMATP